MMKKITLLFMLLAVSFGYAQTLPFDFDNTLHGFIGDGGPAVTNGTGNDVLEIAAGVADWDNAQVTFATPIDLSDDANNTLRFSFQSTTANPGEVHQHGVSFQGGGGAIELNFLSTGTDVVNVELNFQAGLGSREKLVIFTDVGNFGAQSGTGGSTNGTGGTASLSGTYIIDDISLGADPVGADATLSDLQIDAVTVTGFDSNTDTYSYTVAPGTMTVPTVTATTTDAGANAVVTPAASIPGNTTVEVTAANGTTTKIYTVSFGFPVGLPLDFEGSIDGITTTDGATISNGTGNDVLEIVGSVAAWDRALITFTTPVDLSDDANNTLRFTIQSTTAAMGEVHQHGMSFQGGVASHEMNFITTGQDPVDVVLDFGPGLSTGPTLHIFTDVGNFGIQSGTGFSLIDPGNTNGGESGTPALSGTYIIDNISLGATTLSAKDFNKSVFAAYPNPTRNSWTIKTQNDNMSSIKIYDVLGNNVLSLSPNTKETIIDASSLTTGLYFAQIKTDAGINSIKLIKK